MQKSDIKVGKEYVLREKRGSDAPLQRIKILQHVRGKKWKAEWIDPNPGLIDYVESQMLIVSWKERKAYFRDEEKMKQLQADNEKHDYKEVSPIANVLSQVFESLGEKDLYFYRGTLSGNPEALDRVKVRANFSPEKESETTTKVAYIDRFGVVHIPYAEALELAKAICMSEPNTVLVNIESTEREWVQKVSQPGYEYMLSLLNEYRASWALIRQWAGYDAAISQKEAQIQRLERLVLDAIYALQKAGQDDEASRLRRALQKK
ncbi:MAG: hypothetical protein ABSF88_01320 [Candidatus Aminicenantales bacterium]